MTDIPPLDHHALRGDADQALTAVLNYLSATRAQAAALPMYRDHVPSHEQRDAYASAVAYLEGALQSRLDIDPSATGGAP